MPLIRKKTSKRTTTHKRERLKHKVSEGKRKKRKQAKKNPQWKSKKKKDPGIPNNLPFKDDILAEIAEQRRQAEQEKKRRKEENKLENGAETGGASTTGLITPNTSSKANIQDDVPLLLNPELPNLRAVLDKSHVFLCVLDARDPLSFRVSHIEDLVCPRKDAKFAFILNKIDLVPREAVIGWLKHLRLIHPTFAFRSASAFLPKNPGNSKTNLKGKAKESVDDALGCKQLLEYLNQCEVDLGTDSLRVAVIGITNTGKSSIINSLAQKDTVPVYALSASAQAWDTTTTRAYEVDVPQKNIILIDTPGLSFHNDKKHDEDVKVRDILIRRRGRVDKVKEPIPPVQWIVSRASIQDLMVHYNLPAFSKGDANAFISGVARALNLIRKGGELDHVTAARSVLRDWNTGKLPIYTECQTSTSEGQEQPAPSEGDENFLAQLKTRKEMRKEVGLVKLEGGEVEKRLVVLDTGFVNEEGEEREDSQDGEGDDGNDNEGDADEGGEDGEEEEEDPRSVSRKRKASQPDFPPLPKKVAFAAGIADRNEKKAARKLLQQTKEKKQKTTDKLSSKQSHETEKVGKMVNDKSDSKPNAKNKPIIARPSNKGSAKISQVDPDAYDFDQFFKMT